MYSITFKSVLTTGFKCFYASLEELKTTVKFYICTRNQICSRDNPRTPIFVPYIKLLLLYSNTDNERIINKIVNEYNIYIVIN